jgi:hypothetical protein
VREKKWLIAMVAVPALLLALVVAVVEYQLRRPRETPAGQPPLTALTRDNLEQLRERFNAFTEGPRVLVLLSPT